AESGRLWRAYQDVLAGRISRRAFMRRAMALGITGPIAWGLLSAADVSAQEASPAAGGVAAAPTSGTDGQTRGAGGELKLLQWQAPTTLNMQLAGSFKDQLAAALVTEPLIHFLPDATPIPCLVKEVPSKENGLLSADLKTLTYNLLDDVVWSDGEPFTANDVVFTWKWIVDPDNQSPNSALYGAIASVDAVDDHTVKISFKQPQLGWNSYFSSAQSGGILPEHILGGGGANDQFSAKPIGTGPYVVDSFAVGDNVQYSINDRYREPNKPFFSKVNLKGGGDAASAAQAVLQTGDWDFAWNLQVDPKILKPEAEGGKGDLVIVPGTGVEFLALNFSDPNKEVDGQRSQWQTPNPVLSDKAVRQALATSIDRQAISENFYFGPPGEPPTSNILLGIKGATSPNTTWEFDLDKAAAMLDAAGWKLNGDVREKDGVPIKLTYATTSQSDTRQGTQALIKSDWAKIGVQVQLLQIDSSVFFDTSAGNDQTMYHMYWDMHEYAWSPAGPYPLSYMLRWVSDDGKNIPQKDNGWSEVNEERYNNPAYDALYDEATKATDIDKADELFIEMNDMVVDDVVVIPLVQRASEKYAIAKTLNHDNIAGGPFEALYWNIANWNRVG
ncbi:MAG TPA: peptide ABC transporter substrate-binding protein, partial [Thermomicrobiales bacterium]|nr:peptide ABC transporter substrate-binding protein [Thermomicrobiales bacterium]